ncbi:calcium-translocating P-type ATPase PMCA-type [Clostridium sp. CAG:780]|nr:calcium-translocating P-type ATPase PMCA-type [Clostridium sp. CAG:780]
MWYTKELNQIFNELNARQGGLTEDEASKRLEKYGANNLKEKKKESLFIKFIKQFNDFMIIVLIIAAIISAIVAKTNGSGDYIDSIIIIAIVIFNAIMGLIQEEKAEKSLEALKKMSAPNAKVRRNGKIQEIEASQVVPGDVVILEAGNYVPADCRLIDSYNLQIEESSLTGETLPTSKQADVILNANTAIGDLKNMAFATTIVVNGHAEAVVVETGMNTKVGQIAGMIIENESPETPLQKKLGEVGKTLAITCMIICGLIFLIGIWKQIPITEMFMTSVGLAVAAIPEGLPAIVTIMLSIGVTKMAKKNSIIRKLPAVETLGCSSVICSDKTGTLTQNKMTVTQIRNAVGIVKNDDRRFILELGTMCTDTIESQEVIGEATEVAITNAAVEMNLRKRDLYDQMQRINEISFDSKRKMMTTIHKIGSKYRIITKGAPDVLIKRCSQYYQSGRIEPIFSKRDALQEQNQMMAEDALRVIAIAYKDVEKLPREINSETIENELTFVGLIGMIDPPREGVKEAVKTCRKAGIKTVMITGDHLQTAKAIAKELGILRKGDLAINGETLEKMSQQELERDIMRYSVFARVSPEHKVRIVKAFQSTGAVVAMTGDGVNDAPALKNADIGIAMGKCGTDVAKNASDMVLTDDNFVTIVEAVKQGRNIYDNIKKAVHFLLATNIGEIVAIFVGLLLGIKSPLLAIQLLWVNLVTDSLPAIALGLEKAENNIMNRLPRNPRKSLFADGLWGKITTEGVMIGMLTLVAFSIGNNLYSIEVGRTMAFLSLGILELVHSFNIKGEESILKTGLFENRYLVGAFVLGTLLQVVVVVISPLAQIFDVVPLNSVQWLMTAIISILPVVIVELQKKFNAYKFGKVVYARSI